MTDWSSSQYIKFETQRTQPSLDLISRLDHLHPTNILDIGCGPGNSTYALYCKFKHAKILGIDDSENMLCKAKSTYPDIEFRKCRVPDELNQLEESFDLIFSNACIHWIPEQSKLIHSIFQKMNNQATLAVQIPLIQKAPFYDMLSKLIKTPKWNGKLSHIRNFYNLLPEEYYDLLSQLDCTIAIWETVYYHTVPSLNGILEWYKGSGLRPYLNALDKEQQLIFEQDILKELGNYYTMQQNGSILLKMPRLFFTATKI